MYLYVLRTPIPVGEAGTRFLEFSLFFVRGELIRFSHFESDFVTTWLSLPEVHLFFVVVPRPVLHLKWVLPAPPTWIWSFNVIYYVLFIHFINVIFFLLCNKMFDVFYLANKMKW